MACSCLTHLFGVSTSETKQKTAKRHIGHCALASGIVFNGRLVYNQGGFSPQFTNFAAEQDLKLRLKGVKEFKYAVEAIDAQIIE